MWLFDHPSRPSTSPSGAEFSVVLVDSRPAYEAKNLITLLSGYILHTAIGFILRTVNVVLLSAHAMLATGAARCISIIPVHSLPVLLRDCKTLVAK
ncbi:hypothetical protein PGT21_020130 [Puccinia graminis f. sp. tritici]|uniref:Uncharacterized protein n=1 Tax=Puccinia graminis f. sp. tritici TaxID=56615 RepID=A0A5B0SEI4_PUCGR|nr:hypothetical protein PGT21_020130 [Puccinia graminis f. sp. tritici]KAA1136536.1 hypothetical protein PGTUg99_034921 [Puccinia graminis f. sp. tritici]